MEVAEVGGKTWDGDAGGVGAGEEGRGDLVGWGEGEVEGCEARVEGFGGFHGRVVGGLEGVVWWDGGGGGGSVDC